MITPWEDTIYNEAIKIWGKNPQLLVLLEEFSELQKEILKNINREADNLDALIDETADVLIMMEQLQRLYNIKEQVKKRIPEKLKKVEQRLRKEQCF